MPTVKIPVDDLTYREFQAIPQSDKQDAIELFKSFVHLRIRHIEQLPPEDYSGSDSWDVFLSNIEENAIDTGIGDLADQHDHYLYGTPKH